MPTLKELIEIHEQEIKTFNPADAAELENYRIRFLGTKGIVKSLSGEMKNVAPDQRKEAGQMLNAFKQLAEEKYESLKGLAEESAGKGTRQSTGQEAGAQEACSQACQEKSGKSTRKEESRKEAGEKSA